MQRTLLRQGDDGKHVLLLTDGVVKVVTSSESGYEMLAAVRIAGELVGEMAAFEDLPRSGSVIACGDVQVRVIQRGDLEGFLTQHPDAMRELYRMLSARLRWANQRRLDFQAYDAPTRLARVLVELSQAYGLPVAGEPDGRMVLALALTQSELASLAGLKLATAERALANLSQLGLVERNYRKIVISDTPKLLDFARIVGRNPY
ncbi:Crp/Fnr family transcriptional regulator [Streptacidiphilus sp. P02-A3a]|nr:Crp/Fnr family transcriptional regulator [Streptacidiphilus sp. P02-A3a]